MVNKIMTTAEAEPIIHKWIDEAIEAIEKRTGVKMRPEELTEELSDCEWIFTLNDTIEIDNTQWETDTYIDIKTAEKAINHIANRNIKYILDEREEN